MMEPTRKEKFAQKALNLLGILGILLTIVAAIWAFQSGILQDQNKMQALLEKAGIFAPILFILIQILQTIVPILPGAVTIPAAEFMFGRFWGFCLNMFAILLGSILAFWLCRRYGRRLLWVLIGEKSYDKYMNLLNSQTFSKIFNWGMFIPFMPADIFCMVAGVSDMPRKHFLKVLLLSKPISLYFYTYFMVHILQWLSQLWKG